MNLEDFPNYFQAADDISIKSQKRYLIIIKINLVMMIFATLLTVYNFQNISIKFGIYTLVGLCLFFSLALTIILKYRKYEDIWYQGRALAESCKTLTWRFVTCSEYFEKDIELEEVKKRFIERIKSVSKEFKDLSGYMCANILSEHIISEKMLEIRNYSLLERKKIYIENRIEDQQKWYSQKAEWNRKRYIYWFWVIIISQSLAIISIVILLVIPSSKLNIVGFLTTVASSAISWLQIRRYQEQKQAYTTASEELNFIKELSWEINTETDLSKFILDSENAISREHTLWLAQRRK